MLAVVAAAHRPLEIAHPLGHCRLEAMPDGEPFGKAFAEAMVELKQLKKAE